METAGPREPSPTSSSAFAPASRISDDPRPHRCIAGNKFPYYDALDAADAAWKADATVDVSKMEELLGAHLAAQLLEVFNTAKGE